MKNKTVSIITIAVLLIAGMFMVTHQVQASDGFANKIILCNSNGAPLTELSYIWTSGGNASTALPVPQIGSTVEKNGYSYKVIDVQYVYGTESFYCIKVIVSI